MNFLPKFLSRSHEHQNVLKIRTFNHHIRVWLRRPPGSPCPREDYSDVGGWVMQNRPAIDKREPEDVMAEMLKRFPRIAKIEFLNGSLTEGVVVHA